MLIATSVHAQTAPCGRSVLKGEGDATEGRFVAAPLEHVKASVLQALPAVGGRLTKDEGSHVEAKIDLALLKALNNAAAGSDGVKGQMGMGTLLIDLAPETQENVAGTYLAIQQSSGFRRKLSRGFTLGLAWGGNYAKPLADEIVCLVMLLNQVEPASSPRSGVAADSSAPNPHSVLLQAGTIVKIALRNYFYTKEVPKKTDTVDVVLEVVDDVHSDDGSVVIRKGALAKGTVLGLARAGLFGRSAGYSLQVKSATAVDGQDVALGGAGVERKGSSDVAVAGRAALTIVSFLLLTPSGAGERGQEGLVRAGTSWEIPTASEIMVQVLDWN
jgi:hypothetical protein